MIIGLVLFAVWLVGFLLTVRYLKRVSPDALGRWAPSSWIIAILWPIAALFLGFWILVWKLKK